MGKKKKKKYQEQSEKSHLLHTKNLPLSLTSASLSTEVLRHIYIRGLTELSSLEYVSRQTQITALWCHGQQQLNSQDLPFLHQNSS